MNFTSIRGSHQAIQSKVIKFILTDGDNWTFGVVDCTQGRDGRKCHYMTVSLVPEATEAKMEIELTEANKEIETARRETELANNACIVLRLLALWVRAVFLILESQVTEGTIGWCPWHGSEGVVHRIGAGVAPAGNSDSRTNFLEAIFA